jgi:hypothetical protein
MTAPDILYHYTTTSGLVGIVTHCELWASDCQFLNDGTELSYASDIFFAEVAKLNLPSIDGGGYYLAGPSLKYFRMFIACFCEDGDLLSQWRGYGADQGYALGFDTKQLEALNFGNIIPVQYGITNPMEYFAEELEWAGRPASHPGTAEWYASEGLHSRLASVKHPGFAEEHEWRIMKQIPVFDLKKSNTPVQFRPSPMGPIPFLVISFPTECLREIIIGPGNHSETRKNAILDMLRYHDLEHVNVSISKTPFRK